LTFEDLMREHGYEPDLPLEHDRVVRFSGPDEKRSKKSAWYWYVGEAGVLGDWRNGLKVNWFDREKVKANVSKKDQQERYAKRFAESQANKATAKAESQRRWSISLETNMHPYILSKKIGTCGARVYKDRVLLVPMMNAVGDMVNVQRIYPNGDKRFLWGGEVEGCYFKMGQGPAKYICEGFATGATIHRLTKRSVVCAFNCHNLMNVALLFRRDKPTIAADNDHKTMINGELNNPGLNAGMHIAEELGLLLVFPVWNLPEGEKPVTDFNDLEIVAGEKQAKLQIHSPLRLAA
jgi:putative DNA primase/helicase